MAAAAYQLAAARNGGAKHKHENKQRASQRIKRGVNISSEARVDGGRRISEKHQSGLNTSAAISVAARRMTAYASAARMAA